MGMNLCCVCIRLSACVCVICMCVTVVWWGEMNRNLQLEADPSRAKLWVCYWCMAINTGWIRCIKSLLLFAANTFFRQRIALGNWWWRWSWQTQVWKKKKFDWPLRFCSSILVFLFHVLGVNLPFERETGCWGREAFAAKVLLTLVSHSSSCRRPLHVYLFACCIPRFSVLQSSVQHRHSDSAGSTTKLTSLASYKIASLPTWRLQRLNLPLEVVFLYL